MNIDQMTDDELIKLASTDFESVLKSRGYKFGWYKPTEYVGYIYIMVNPIWKEPSTNKELSKIGYTDSLEQRVRSFSGTGYPYPSHCYAAYKVSDRLVDKPLHVLIDMLAPNLRIVPNKEYYELPKEDAYKILESIAKITGTIDCLELNPLNDEYFESGDIESEDTCSKQIVDDVHRVTHGYHGGYAKLVGEKITWKDNPGIECEVVDSHHVKYNGIITTFIKATRSICKSASPRDSWMYDGKSISEICI